MTNSAAPLPSDAALTIDFIIHLDALPASEWSGTDDERPLTDLGRNQSEWIADALLRAGPIDALFSGPAARCYQSLEPLAERLRLPINKLSGFNTVAHTGQEFSPPEGYSRAGVGNADPALVAYVTGAFEAALAEIRGSVSNRRVVACLPGDIFPRHMAFLAGRYGVEIPPRFDRKGSVYSIIYEGHEIRVSSRDAAPDFPNDDAKIGELRARRA